MKKHSLGDPSVFEIDKILKKKIFYFIKWKGFGNKVFHFIFTEVYCKLIKFLTVAQYLGA
jgi:hypothetical protein